MREMKVMLTLQKLLKRLWLAHQANLELMRALERESKWLGLLGEFHYYFLSAINGSAFVIII
jgi:hypothetical protein